MKTLNKYLCVLKKDKLTVNLPSDAKVIDFWAQSKPQSGVYCYATTEGAKDTVPVEYLAVRSGVVIPDVAPVGSVKLVNVLHIFGPV